jgi:hypothetical protein
LKLVVTKVSGDPAASKIFLKMEALRSIETFLPTMRIYSITIHSVTLCF